MTILEQIKHCDITIVYVKPDIDLLNDTRVKQERLVYNVLQEYTRSGVFERIILISNPSLEKIIGSVPIATYHEKLNEAIIWTLHMLNVFDNIVPIINHFSTPSDIARILTVGVMDIEKNEEKLFFELDNVLERCYYYSINQKILETDGEIFKVIKEQIKERKTGDTKVSYGIYPTEQEQNYAFCLCRSSEIQK